MKNSSIRVRLAVQDPEVNEKIVRALNILHGFQIVDIESQTPDLVIYELGRDLDSEFNFLKSLLESENGPDVILTSCDISSEVLLEALRLGVKEFIPQPVDEAEAIKGLERYRSKTKTASGTNAKDGKVAYVVGCKGGVGATTLAVNLSAALAGRGKECSVLLMDMNVLYGDIHIFLDIKPEYHWGEIAGNIDRLDSVFFSNLLTTHPSGIHVLSSPGMLNGHGRLTAETMSRLLQFMKENFDFIIMDGGHSMDESVLKAIQASDYLLLISELNLGCMANTNKLLHFFSQMNVIPQDHIKLLINRHTKKSELTLDDVKESIKRDPFWVMPNDYKTVNSTIFQGQSLMQASPKAPLTRSILDLADHLFPAEPKKRKSGGIFKRLNPFNGD